MWDVFEDLVVGGIYGQVDLLVDSFCLHPNRRFFLLSFTDLCLSFFSSFLTCY